MPSQFLKVAEIVLREQLQPLTARRIIALGKEQGLLSDKLVGKTPHQTLKSKLSVDIRRRGKNSVFVRTAPGRFYLRELVVNPSEEYIAPPLRPADSKEQVLAFPGSCMDELGPFQGISKG